MPGDAHDRGPRSVAWATLVREHAAGCASLYAAPLIPAGKEERARMVHALHLPASEPILALYDATLFGSGGNGFLLTAERICWKNSLEHPRQVPWGDLDVASVLAHEDRVELAGGFVRVADAAAPVAAKLVAAFAGAHRAASGGPYRKAGDAAPDGVARLVHLARVHVGEIANMHYAPAIPPAKLRNACAVHAASLAPDERVAVLYDDTLFESAEEGFLLTPRVLCWKNLVGAPASRAFRTLRREQIELRAGVLHVAGAAVTLSLGTDRVARVAELLASVTAEGPTTGEP
jgi:hypothetical protein